MTVMSLSTESERNTYTCFYNIIVSQFLDLKYLGMHLSIFFFSPDAYSDTLIQHINNTENWSNTSSLFSPYSEGPSVVRSLE